MREDAVKEARRRSTPDHCVHVSTVIREFAEKGNPHATAIVAMYPEIFRR